MFASFTASRRLQLPHYILILQALESQDVGFEYQRNVPPQATYIFKHALIQDATYQSLLRSSRRQIHQRIAQIFETQFSETASIQPELLTHHYTETDHPMEALGY